MSSRLSHAPTTDTRRVQAVIHKLERSYGVPRWQPNHDPLGELIATILSQNTSDVNADRAFAALRTAYPTWEGVLQAEADDVAAVIRSGGLATLKTQRIQAILQALQERYGDLRLDGLSAMPMPAARAFLAQFPGVGPKTVACVLLFACGHPALPVDTHVHRVTSRLGWLPLGCTAERAHAVLEPLIPPTHVYSAHVNLIRHGRTVCKARQPACAQCPLRSCCPFPRRQEHTRTRGLTSPPALRHAAVSESLHDD
jgi:endonuclease-3